MWRRKTNRRASRGSNRHRDDFSGLWLDDVFSQEASVVELSAEQRAAKGRRDEFDRNMDEGIRQAARAAGLARGARRRRRVPAVIVIVAVVSLLGWRTVDSRRARPASSPSGATDPGPDRLVYDAKLTDLPPPSTEEAPAPLGQPAPHAAVSDGFRFTATQSGSNGPVAYDPCRPIHVVVNNRTAPPAADVILRAAVKAVNRASGLVFIIDGPTDEAPNPERSPYQPDRYPQRWAPVLVAWSDPAESPALAGAVASPSVPAT